MPQIGEDVFVEPSVDGARDQHGRPIVGRTLVSWSEHWQRAYSRGDVLCNAPQPEPAQLDDHPVDATAPGEVIP